MIPLAFVLVACIATGPVDTPQQQCDPIAYYDTLEKCEERKAYLESFWQAQFDTPLPVPVHCEDHRT